MVVHEKAERVINYVKDILSRYDYEYKDDIIMWEKHIDRTRPIWKLLEGPIYSEGVNFTLFYYKDVPFLLRLGYRKLTRDQMPRHANDSMRRTLLISRAHNSGFEPPAHHPRNYPPSDLSHYQPPILPPVPGTEEVILPRAHHSSEQETLREQDSQHVTFLPRNFPTYPDPAPLHPIPSQSRQFPSMYETNPPVDVQQAYQFPFTRRLETSTHTLGSFSYSQLYRTPHNLYYRAHESNYVPSPANPENRPRGLRVHRGPNSPPTPTSPPRLRAEESSSRSEPGGPINHSVRQRGGVRANRPRGLPRTGPNSSRSRVPTPLSSTVTSTSGVRVRHPSIPSVESSSGVRVHYPVIRGNDTGLRVLRPVRSGGPSNSGVLPRSPHPLTPPGVSQVILRPRLLRGSTSHSASSPSSVAATTSSSSILRSLLQPNISSTPSSSLGASSSRSLLRPNLFSPPSSSSTSRSLSAQSISELNMRPPRGPPSSRIISMLRSRGVLPGRRSPRLSPLPRTSHPYSGSATRFRRRPRPPSPQSVPGSHPRTSRTQLRGRNSPQGQSASSLPLGIARLPSELRIQRLAPPGTSARVSSSPESD